MTNFKKYAKLVRPLDVVIVVLLMIGSFIPHYIFGRQTRSIDETSEVVAVISIDGEEVKRVRLSEETPHEQFTFHPAEGQYNIIEVDGKKIRNKEDNSPDQIAVKTGWISKPGETSICLPHKLIIEIKADSPIEDSEDDIIVPL
ncbi:MAG: NusG domain II-containing protein [Carnobacterium sp.]|uniref:NusG domain II-containing protein n=1 Tax=unclassified Carnobacterium TaxID=257487 RepID=UPI0019143782|nr:NusG domain II-containing protein [Carnobacterium sp. CS13]QQP70373.1 NusG domain II-containing protein [Carnobacterium sp. CS13]